MCQPEKKTKEGHDRTYLEEWCQVPLLGVPPTLLNTAGNHHQHKLQRLMDTIQVKASSTQGMRSRLARARPRAGTAVPDEFTPRPSASSDGGRTLGSPEAQLGHASSRSNLGQIALPTDRIVGAFNAKIVWHLILIRTSQSARSKRPQSLRPFTDRPDRKTAPLAPLRLLCHPPG